MAVKHLYSDDYETFNNDAQRLSQEASIVLQPIIDRYCDEGYSMRDVESVLLSEVAMLVSVKVLTRNSEMHRETTNARRAETNRRLVQSQDVSQG